MENNFKLEIISPEKIIFSDLVKMTKVPSYEGDMSILKNHISIITFLRPGLVKVEKKGGDFEEFFVQDGTVEFFNNNMVVLSTSVENIKNLSKDFIEKLSSEITEKLKNTNLTDEDKYLLHHKLDTIKAVKL